MIKSIIFSSIFHILIILIIIFSMGNPDRKQPAKTKEIKVNIIEQKIKKKRVRKVTSKIAKILTITQKIINLKKCCFISFF